jgi:hypothetical protein
VSILTPGYFGLPVELLVEETTDLAALTTVRREQGRLRDHLMAGRPTAECALCGRVLPRRLLVAAHIAPRRTLSDSQRQRFDEIAMLACALGCDALFEWGLVVVDEDGIIRPGAAATTPDLRAVVRRLADQPCTAFDQPRAPAFAAHRAMHLSPQR